MVVGCAPGNTANTDTPTTRSLPPEDLVTELDDVLEFTYRDRTLSLQQHAAWQILHGVLAYQQDFAVQQDGQSVSAVDYLLQGGTMKGWTLQVVTDQPNAEPGIRAMLDAGSQTGQGHPDQWLAIIAQCDVPIDQPIRVEGQDLTLRHFVSQVQWDVPRNVLREYSWTLIGLTHYLPTDASWTASDGETWSIERLVQIEAEQELGSSACGGTHRLIGLTMALRQHLAGHGRMAGSWKLADTVIRTAIAHAREYQNPDGSFSTRHFDGPGSSPDLAQNLGTSGHILEFLSLALDDEELHEPWVIQAVTNLCNLFRLTRDVPLECGALYHAAHGLVLYRARIFGPRRHDVEDSDATPATDGGSTPSPSPPDR